MNDDTLARYIGRIVDTDDPRELARLEAELFARGDSEAATVARQAALKRRRLTAAN